MKRNLLSRVVSVFMLMGMVFSSVPAPAYAVLYSPGETLNPACAPTDANCDVITLAIKGRLSEALIGTVGITPSSSLVTGSSTVFTTELSAGDAIKIGPNVFTIGSISSNTSLTLSSAVATSTATTTGATAYRDPTTLFSIATGANSNVLTVSKAGLLALINALTISSSTPATTANALYNQNGTLYWNGNQLSGGILSLNNLSSASQTFATSSTGADFSIISSGSTHTFNLPTATSTVRGLLTSADWIAFNNKQNAITASSSSAYYRGDKTWQTLNTTAVAEGSNLYYSDARTRNALSSSALGLTYSTSTGAFGLTSGYNIPLTASTTNWNTFYNTPSNRITAGTGLSWTGNTLAVNTGALTLASATADGIVSTTTQTFAGAKTFSGATTLATTTITGSLMLNSISLGGVKASTVHHSATTTLALTNAYNNMEIHAESTGGFSIDANAITGDTWGAMIISTDAPGNVTLTTTNFSGAFLRDGTVDAGFTTLTIAPDEAYHLTITDNAGAKFLNVTRLSGGGTANAFTNNGNSFGGLATLGTTDNNALRIVASSTEAMRILANGNIGIGTTTPSSKLAITGNTAITAGTIATTTTCNWDPNLDLTSGRLLHIRPDSLISGSLATWSDLSGTGNHMTQSTTAAQPTVTTNSLNGLSTVGFDGVDDRMLSAVTTTMKPATVFAVLNITDHSTGRSIIGGESDGGTGGGDFYWSSNASPTNVYLTKRGAVNIGQSTNPIPTASWNIVDVSYGSAGAWAHWLNGSANGSGTNDQTLTASKLALGVNGFINPNSTKFLGSMAEVIIYNSVLSQADQEKIEGYLAWKYGLQGNLPAGHTYKNAAPTVAIATTTTDPSSGNLTVANTITANSLNLGSFSGLLFANVGAVSNFATSTGEGKVLGVQSGALAWITPASGGSATTTINGASGPSFTFNTGITGTDFTISTSTNTLTFNLPSATSTVRGLLTSSDWTTFNNKLSATLNNGQIHIGNTSNAATGVTMSGDATLSNAGVLTLATTTVSSGSYGSSTTIPIFAVDSKGRITAASATSTPFLTSALSFLNGLSVSSQTFTVGTSGNDFGITSTSSTHTFNLPDAGATARGLVSTSTQTIAGAKTFSSAPIISPMTSGSVLFAGTGGLVSQNNAGLFWDSTNNRLGIGTTTPGDKLQVSGGDIRMDNNYGISFLKSTGVSDTTRIYRGTSNALRVEANDGDLILKTLGTGAGIQLKKDAGDTTIGNIALNSGNTYFTVGNFGIGTASPSAKFDVTGSARFQQSSGADGAADAFASGRGLNTVAGGLAFDQDVYGLAGVVSVGGAASGGSANTSDIIGVYGKASVAGGAGANTRIIGVYGEGSGTGSYAGYFQGNTYVNGGTTLASTTPAITASTLYNQGGSLYWNGSAVGGGSSQWTTSGSNIYYNTGNVGIGTSTPSSRLMVVGQVSTTTRNWDPNLDLTSGRLLHIRPDSLTSGSLATWSDLSGTGNHMTQSTSAAQPTVTTNSLNGLPTVGFDGVDDSMLSTVTTTMKPVIVFAVLNITNHSTGRSIIGGESDGGTGGGDFYWSSNASPTNVYLTKRNAVNIGQSTNPIPTASWNIVDVSYGSAGAWAHWLNGSANGSGTNDQTLTASKLALGVNGFINPNNTKFFGSMAEVIVYNSVLSQADQEKIEGYLAWKYGLQGNLPAGHTYKNAAPTVAIASPTVNAPLLQVTDLGSSTSTILALFENSATNQACIISGSTGLSCSSDITLKKNVNGLGDSLGNVLALKPVNFDWNNEVDGSGNHIGFISQDVEKIFPGLVVADPNGKKALSYDKFAPIIVKALQEQYGGMMGIIIAEVDDKATLFSATSTLAELAEARASETFIGNPVGYITERVEKGIKIMRTLVTEKLIAVNGYFKRIFANELCLVDENTNELVCVDANALKNLSGAKTSSIERPEQNINQNDGSVNQSNTEELITAPEPAPVESAAEEPIAEELITTFEPAQEESTLEESVSEDLTATPEAAPEESTPAVEPTLEEDGFVIEELPLASLIPSEVDSTSSPQVEGESASESESAPGAVVESAPVSDGVISEEAPSTSSGQAQPVANEN